MIKPEQIPPEVRQAIIRALRYGDASSDKIMANALNAWPEAFDGHTWTDLVPTLVLPLGKQST